MITHITVALVLCCGPCAPACPQQPSTPATVLPAKAVAQPAPRQDYPATQAPAAPRHRGEPSKASMGAAARGIASWFQDPEHVLFDQPRPDGALWALGSNFKASFDAHGWNFIPQPLTGAPELEPIHFHLAAARVGTRQLAIADVAPTRSERCITFAHGDVVQTVEIDGRGVEQRFIFASLPERANFSSMSR